MHQHKNNIKAVIFDMDGVLVDSEPVSDKHMQQYMKKMGIELPYSYFEQFRGANAKSMWTKIKNDFQLQPSIEHLIIDGRVNYNEYLDSLPLLIPIPGVTELIKKLQKEHFMLALASSASLKRIKKILNMIGLANEFEIISSGDDVARGKPDPEIFLKTAGFLKISPSNCVVIEDSENGVKSAKAAGMKVIGFAGLAHNKENLSQADMIIYSYNEISSDIIQA